VKEEVIISLQILRKAYVTEVMHRHSFISLNGCSYLFEYLKSGDIDIIMEVLFNIEDLVYVSKL
jgi:hypothetical protein